jgi:hypothetical protein
MYTAPFHSQIKTLHAQLRQKRANESGVLVWVGDDFVCYSLFQCAAPPNVIILSIKKEQQPFVYTG